MILKIFCTTILGTFDFDICRFECLVSIWRAQVEDCGVDLPDMTTVIDKTRPEAEQWDMAVSLWTQLRDAWSAEAVTRGVKVASPTPTQGISFKLMITHYHYHFCTMQTLINQGLTNGSQA